MKARGALRSVLNKLRVLLPRFQDAPDDVVVSLTSYPERIPKAHHAIRSVLAGSLRPQTMVLYLAAEEIEGRPLTRSLVRMQDKGFLVVKVVNDNFRSANKLLHAVQDYPKARIVTIDDDIIYPRDLLKSLVEMSHQQPRSICAHRAIPVVAAPSGDLVPFATARRFAATRVSKHVFPEGLHGVLYPPNSLASEAFILHDYLRLAATTDDIWFGAHAHRAGTEIFVHPIRQGHFLPIPGRSKGSLWENNSSRSLNDKNLKAIVDSYPDLGSWPAGLDEFR